MEAKPSVEALTRQLHEMLNRPQLTQDDLRKMSSDEIAAMLAKDPEAIHEAMKRPGAKTAEAEKPHRTPDGKLTREGLKHLTQEEIAAMPADERNAALLRV